MWIVYIQKITLVTKRRTERQAVIFIQKIKIRKVKKVKIMCYSRKVEPSVIEREMQESRNKEEFIGKVETITIKQIVENAKINSRFGDKIPVSYTHLLQRILVICHGTFHIIPRQEYESSIYMLMN